MSPHQRPHGTRRGPLFHARHVAAHERSVEKNPVVAQMSHEAQERPHSLATFNDKCAGHPCRSGAGQGCCRSFFLALATSLPGTPKRRRGQGSGVARPRSGRRALTPCRSAHHVGLSRDCGVSFGVLSVRVGVARIIAGGPGGRRRGAARSSLRDAQPGGRRRMMGVRAVPGDSVGRGQSERSTSPRRSGGHDLHDPRPTECSGVSCRHRWCRAARGPGGRAGRSRRTRSGRGRPPRPRCCGPGGPRPGPGPHRPWCGPGRICTDSTAAQRTSREPCLVIRPRCTWVSDSRCLGVNPAQQASSAAVSNRVTSPTSATNTAPRIGPDPGDLLHREIAGIAGQPAPDLPANGSISKSKASMSRRSEPIRAA